MKKMQKKQKTRLKDDLQGSPEVNRGGAMLGLFQLIECRKICIVRHWIFQQKTGVYASFGYDSGLVYLCYGYAFVFLIVEWVFGRL